MTTDTKHIVRMADAVFVAALRAGHAQDKAQRRAEIVVKFEQLCADAGKLCIEDDRPNWLLVSGAALALLGKAIEVDEARIGTMVNAGTIAGLWTSVAALGRVLGFRVADAASEPDDAAPVAVEGLRSAAE